jgi:hypothetical protein
MGHVRGINMTHALVIAINYDFLTVAETFVFAFACPLANKLST